VVTYKYFIGVLSVANNCDLETLFRVINEWFEFLDCHINENVAAFLVIHYWEYHSKERATKIVCNYTNFIELNIIGKYVKDTKAGIHTSMAIVDRYYALVEQTGKNFIIIIIIIIKIKIIIIILILVSSQTMLYCEWKWVDKFTLPVKSLPVRY